MKLLGYSAPFKAWWHIYHRLRKGKLGESRDGGHFAWLEGVGLAFLRLALAGIHVETQQAIDLALPVGTGLHGPDNIGVELKRHALRSFAGTAACLKSSVNPTLPGLYIPCHKLKRSAVKNDLTIYFGIAPGEVSRTEFNGRL